MPGDSMLLLIGFCLRATVVLALAWALTAAMRRAAASTRHLVWTCALVGAALVPAMSIAAPPWQVATPPALASLSSAIALPITTRVRAPRQAAAPVAQPTPEIDPDVQARPPAPPASVRSADRDYAGMALSAWAAGTIGILIYMLAGAVAAWRIRRSTAPLDAPWIEEAHALAEAFDIRGQVTFVESASTAMPIVCGLWRPLIILPRSAADWPAERLRIVVLHELAHVKRRDCLTQALAQIVCAAYWFNPLVWIAARRLRDERERACDDFVLAAGTKGSEYAGHLLEIARAMGRARYSPLASTGLAMAHRSQLEGRLMAILDPATRRSSAFYARVAAVAAVLLVSIPVAAVQLRMPASATRNVSAAIVPSAVLVPSPVTSPRDLVADAPAPQAAIGQAAAGAQSDDDRAKAEVLRRFLGQALIGAAEDGDVKKMMDLLEAGADVNAMVPGDGNALMAAASDGHVDVVRLLLERGANPNGTVPGDGSPLIKAASDGHVDVIRLLLDRGADVNAIVPGDGSPLIAAAEDGHIDVVRLLLDRGADVNLAADGDGTPLIAAVEDGQADVVTLLLDRGADIERVVDGDENALITASDEGNLEMVKLLVARGADVNARVLVDVYDWNDWRIRPSRTGQEWRTPLGVASREGHLDVMRYLISAGARE